MSMYSVGKGEHWRRHPRAKGGNRIAWRILVRSAKEAGFARPRHIVRCCLLASSLTADEWFWYSLGPRPRVTFPGQTERSAPPNDVLVSRLLFLSPRSPGGASPPPQS
jgi:hypothetical protein